MTSCAGLVFSVVSVVSSPTEHEPPPERGRSTRVQSALRWRPPLGDVGTPGSATSLPGRCCPTALGLHARNWTMRPKAARQRQRRVCQEEKPFGWPRLGVASRTLRPRKPDRIDAADRETACEGGNAGRVEFQYHFRKKKNALCGISGC